MRIVGRSRLGAFCHKHADARRWIENWLAEAEAASWTSPHEIKRRYASASFVAANTVIFNVKGNDYRLEVTVAYRTAVVVVNWIGTHGEYTRRNRRR
jgi:mRNA interferase HigB